MKDMQQLQLPDGTLLTIEGSNAHETANFILNRLGLTRPAPGPVGNSSLVLAQSRCLPLVDAENCEEPPLLAPVLNFAKPGRNEQPKEDPRITTYSDGGEPPLLPPKLF